MKEPALPPHFICCFIYLAFVTTLQVLAKCCTQLHAELAFPGLVKALRFFCLQRSWLPCTISGHDRHEWREGGWGLLKKGRKIGKQEGGVLLQDLLHLDMKLIYRLLPLPYSLLETSSADNNSGTYTK